MRHQYVESTTARFIKWYPQHMSEHGDPPSYADIVRWLDKDEDYRNPMRAMQHLCVGLREQNQHFMLQRIACVVLYELEQELEFSNVAERFFNALSRRCGIDDTEVRMFDGHRYVGRLHDLQLHKEKSDA